MMGPAPGLLSIMPVAPRSFAISCASVRAITSVPPPGANGTTILTTWSGYKAHAVPFTAGSSSANAASAKGGKRTVTPLRRAASLSRSIFISSDLGRPVAARAMRPMMSGHDTAPALQRWTGRCDRLSQSFDDTANIKAKYTRVCMRALWGERDEALPDRIAVAGGDTGPGAAERSHHCLRV